MLLFKCSLLTFFLGFIFGETILKNCDHSNESFQKESVTAAEGLKMASLIVQNLQITRNLKQFALFWGEELKRDSMI